MDGPLFSVNFNTWCGAAVCVPNNSTLFYACSFGYFVVGLLGVCALGLVLGLMYCCFKLHRSMNTTTHTRARRLDERNGSSRPLNKQVTFMHV